MKWCTEIGGPHDDKAYDVPDPLTFSPQRHLHLWVWV